MPILLILLKTFPDMIYQVGCVLSGYQCFNTWVI